MQNFMQNKWKKWVLLSAFFAVANYPFLQAFSNNVQQDSILPTSIVVGNRYGNAPSEGIYAGNVVVISNQELKQIPAFSIDQIMRFAGGVEVQSRSSFGAQADFSIRGSTFSQVLVLVDGVRIFDPLTAHSNNYIPVAIEEIERIEVIRGGASYIYGPDAIGGAILIVTKLANVNAKKNDIEDVANASVGAGSYGLDFFRGGAMMSFLQKKLRMSIGVNSVQVYGNELPSGLKNFSNMATASLGLAYDVNPSLTLAYRVGAYSSDFNAQNYYTLSVFDSAQATQRAFFNQFSLHQVKKNLSVRRLDLSWQRSIGTFLFNSMVPKNEHSTDFIFLQGVEQFVLNNKHKANVGFQFDQKGIQSSDRGNHVRNHIGGFANSQYQFVKSKLMLESAIRYDYDERGGHFWSPNMSLYKIFSKGNIGLKFGRSNRVADFTELFVSHQLPSVGNMRNFGNPNLAVENAWNAEISFAYQVRNTRFAGAVFHRWGSRIIDYVATPGYMIPNEGNLNDSFSYMFPQNISDVNFAGAEWSVSHKQKLGQNFTLNVQLMYVYVESSLQEGVYTKYISNHARHQLQLSCDLNYKQKAGLTVAWFYKQRPDEAVPPTQTIVPSPQISVLNLGAYAFVIKELVALQVRVENVMDLRYIDVSGAAMAPRWFSFGVMLRY